MRRAQLLYIWLAFGCNRICLTIILPVAACHCCSYWLDFQRSRLMHIWNFLWKQKKTLKRFFRCPRHTTSHKFKQQGIKYTTLKKENSCVFLIYRTLRPVCLFGFLKHFYIEFLPTFNQVGGRWPINCLCINLDFNNRLILLIPPLDLN